VIKYKQGKQNIMTDDVLSRRYVLLSTLDARFLGFEHIKELYNEKLQLLGSSIDLMDICLKRVVYVFH
jgi:hypothetical protein